MQKRRSKDWVGTLLAGLAILIYCVSFYAAAFPVIHPRFELAAEKRDAAGIALDTSFLLTDHRQIGTDPDELMRHISFAPQPSHGYEIQAVGEYTYRLTPGGELAPGGALDVQVYDQEFLFNVQNRLMVHQSFPTNDAGNVPTNTGIEIVLNVDDVTPEAFGTAFSISPSVAGRTRVVKNRYIFEPTTQLNYSTTYTVQLSAGLLSESGASLEDDYSFSFKTQEMPYSSYQNTSQFQMSGNGISINSLVTETPLFQAYISPELTSAAKLGTGGSVSAGVFAFPSWEEYAGQLSQNISTGSYGNDNRIIIDKSMCTEVARFDIEPVRAFQGDGTMDTNQWILSFPEPLTEGWYAVEFELDTGRSTATRKMFLQVSDLSVFYMWSDQNFLAWVNDAATGLPVNGAQVALDGDYSLRVTTGADGTAKTDNATLPTGNDYGTYGNLITVRDGERVFIDINKYYYQSYNYGTSVDSRRYISYLYLDRPTYHTSDTIYAWGMVRPRDAGTTPAPQTATLAFNMGGTEQSVALMPDGTFTAEISFTDMVGDRWGNVDLMVENTVVFSQYLVIEDFVKPIFTANTDPSHEVYLLGVDPTPSVEFQLSMFDGTPASSVKLGVSSYTDGVSIPTPNMTTDADGHAAAEIQVAANKDTWYPQYISYYFWNHDAQAENFYAFGGFYVIHRDVMLQTERIPLQSGDFDLRVSACQVDISNLKDTAQLWQTDEFKGAALDIPITAEIYRVYYTKEITGTYYDYINRTMREMYTYTRHEERVEERNTATQNGTVQLGNLPAAGDGEYYYVKLSCIDSLSRPVSTTVYLGKVYEYYGMQDSGLRYELRKTNEDPPFAIQDEFAQDSWYYRYYGSAFYDGENTTFSLLANEEQVQQMPGSILYCVVQDQISNVGISNSSSFTVPFSENLLPNYVMTGAYFDGKHIYALENTQMYFDPVQRELEIELMTDKESYRPAESVTVTAVVRNKLTGEPAPDVSLVLSVVDEAVFAIREQYINILERLYQHTYWPNIVKYVSYHQGALSSPGEKGNGGDDSMRTDFEDTAFFAVLTTDTEGIATWTFTLPDNITSWRLTSLGVNDRNHAGSAKINVVATKEFFLMPVINENMLEGDSFSVGLRGAGIEVADTDEVQYTVRVQGPGVDEIREIISPVRRYTTLEFDAVAKEGSYTVTVEGRCGGYYDGMQLPVTVQASGVEVSLVRTFDLAQGIDVAPLRYPVNIVFYSEGAKTYNEVLRSVRNSSYGARADMRLARAFTAQLMQELDRNWYDRAALEQNLSDIDGRQMLSMLPYSQRDFELSLRAHLAAPDLVSLDFFQNASADDLESLRYYNGNWAALQLAKALAGQPLDDDLNAYLTDNLNLDYVEKIWLVMALATSGDEVQARQWYKTLVEDNLARQQRADGPDALYISGVTGSRTQMERTAAALLLATRLKTDEAEGLALYLAGRPPQYDLYILEQMHYLRMNQPERGDVGGRFRYQMDGVLVEETAGTDMKSLSFNASRLAAANFEVLSGTVFADVYYVSAPANASMPDARRIGVTKTIEPVGSNGFTVGELVKIIIKPDFSGLPSGGNNHFAFVIDDYIPSGLRFERMESNSYGRGWYLDNRQGQRLQFNTFSLYYEGWRTSVVYYARVATPGEFVVENTYVSSAYGDTWGATERSQIVLR